MTQKHVALIALIWCACPEVSPTFAQTDSSAVDDDTQIEVIGENVYRIGGVTLDGNKREIELPGYVNMSHGLVELLACAPGGKTHESVLVLEVEPYHMQVALLSLGLEARGNLEYQGDPRAPDGDPVEIFVEWVDEATGKVQRHRGEDLVYNIQQKRPMTRTHWVFTGSRIVDGVFEAQVEGSLVTTYHDPNTIIDNPLPTGGDDTLYEANRDVLPPVHTRVTMTIKVYEP